MKTFIIWCTLAATGILSADEFDFSYAMSDGHVFSGSFDGTADGVYVDNVSNFSASIDGLSTPWRTSDSNPLFAMGTDATGPQSFTYTEAPVFSFDAALNNFVFSDVDIASGSLNDSWFFGMYAYQGSPEGVTLQNLGWGITPLADGTLVCFPEYIDNEDADPTHWSLVDVSTSPAGVPETGWTAPMLAAGLLALFSIGRLCRLGGQRNNPGL